MIRWLSLLIFVLGCSSARKAAPPVTDNNTPSDVSEAPLENLTSDTQEAEEVAPPPPTPIPGSNYSELGKALRSRSEESVIHEASKILGKNSKDLKTLNAISVMYIVNRKLDMAKIILARAIKFYPNDPSLACNLGIVKMLEEKIPEAIVEFQRALSADQSHAEASYHLGSIHMRYKNAEAALPLLSRAYSKLPKNIAGPHYAEALRMARKSREAQEVYEALKAETSRDPALVVGYASLLVEDIKDKKRGLKMIDRIRLLTEDAAILKKADDLAGRQ